MSFPRLVPCHHHYSCYTFFVFLFFRKLIELNPNHKLSLRLAIAYRRLRQWHKALKWKNSINQYIIIKALSSSPKIIISKNYPYKIIQKVKRPICSQLTLPLFILIFYNYFCIPFFLSCYSSMSGVLTALLSF